MNLFFLFVFIRYNITGEYMKNYNILSKNGYKISCGINIPEEPQQVLLALHGFTGNKQGDTYTEISKSLEKKGFATVSFNFIGHGDSEVNPEELRMENVLDDIEDVVSWIVQKYPKFTLDLFATSFGAYSALLYLAKREDVFRHVILRAPAVNMDRIMEKLKEVKIDNLKPGDKVYFKKSTNTFLSYDFLADLKENNVFELYKDKKRDLFIIYGGEDSLVPAIQVKKFIKMVGAAGYAMPTSSHLLQSVEEKDLLVSLVNYLLT